MRIFLASFEVSRQETFTTEAQTSQRQNSRRSLSSYPLSLFSAAHSSTRKADEFGTYGRVWLVLGT